MKNYFLIKYLTWAIVVIAIPTSSHAQKNDQGTINPYINDHLLRLKDFNILRTDVLNSNSLEYTNIVNSEIIPTQAPSSTITVSETEVRIEYPKTLKERRIEAHQGWKQKSAEEKEVFFSTLPKAAIDRLQERKKFLRTRLGLSPTRGKVETAE